MRLMLLLGRPSDEGGRRVTRGISGSTKEGGKVDEHEICMRHGIMCMIE